VIFTSDNGPWLTQGADGGSAGPLRDGKGSTWEGGVRVPTVAWWPGKVPAGTSCDTVAGTIDVLPTFVTLAGGTVPAEPKIDGKNIAPLLLGQSKESPREAHYYFSQYNLQAVRQGPWKLALVPQRNMFGGVKDDPDANPMRLYNLEKDIGERTNVAAQHPEVVTRLQALAATMEAEIGGKEPSARRPPGVVENPVTLHPTAPPGKPAAKSGEAKGGKAGETRSGADAPAVGGKAFTVKCEFETKQADAQLLAHGGLAAGYALRLRGGKVVFQVRHDKGDAGLTELSGPTPVNGRTAVTAGLAADGTLTLRVNDAEPVTAKSPGPLPRQPAEDYCLGHDNGAPVGRDAAPAFEGTHLRVTVTAP
jgi:arylsulfatase A